MATTFDTFIKARPSGNVRPITHTRIGDKERKIYGGSYHITDSDHDAFLDHYFNKVFIKGEQEFITEKQLIENGPLLVDIDLNYKPTINERQHTEHYVIDLIALYLDKMNQFITVEENTTINVFVLEKKHVNQLETKTKDGIHLIFGIQVHKAIQVLIREEVVKDISTIWEDLPIQNTWEQVVDEGVTKGHVNWQLYGSRKPGHEAYLISNHYTVLFSNNEWSIPSRLKETFDTKTYIKQLCARYTQHPKSTIKETVREQFERAVANIHRRQPQKLVIVNSDTDIKTILQTYRFDKIKNEEILDKVIEHMLDPNGSFDGRISELHKLSETHQYTMGLPKDYYGPGSYDKWIRVGWALANTSPKLFVSWLKMSCRDNCRSTLSKGGKFDWSIAVHEMFELWKGFECGGVDGLTHRSIMYWCKRNAYKTYQEIVKNTLDYFIDQTTNSIDPKGGPATEFDLASVLFHLFKDRFVCVSIKHKCWYEYINHRWIEIDSGSTLRIGISKEMHHEYLIRIHDLTTKMQTMEQNDSNYESMRKKTHKLAEIAMTLKKTKWKDNIMREACEQFYDKNFLDKLDENPYLMCFNNGIVDFKSKKHRPGQPDDYVSNCTNIDYIPLTPLHDPIIARITSFMEELFPNESLRKYMWEHLASVLIGTMDNQTFNIYTGSGRNGKSCLVDLMGKVLGNYKGTVPSTLITQKRPSIGSTSSEVVALKGTRYAVIQEPSKGDRINEGIMKEITGGDPIQGRALFKDTITFIPQFKLVVTTNVLFDIKSNDDGTWRRIRVCDFQSKFLENPYTDDTHFPKDQFPYQFPLNKKLNENFEQWAPVFASMLVKIAYETQGNVKDCDIVMASSNDYREGQDYMAEFAKEKIIKSVGGKIQKKELIQTFREWYQTSYGTGIPKAIELHTYMNKRYGLYKKGAWHDVKIVYDEDELQNTDGM